MVPPEPIPAPAPVQLALGLHFVPSAPAALSGPETEPDPGASAALNVVAMSGQYRWLAERSSDPTLAFDPGIKDPLSGYPTAPFAAFLDDLLLGLVDGGIVYRCELFLMDHIINDGWWVRGGGHIFKLLADDVALVQEARIGGVDFDVEILISVQVLA